MYWDLISYTADDNRTNTLYFDMSEFAEIFPYLIWISQKHCEIGWILMGEKKIPKLIKCLFCVGIFCILSNILPLIFKIFKTE